MATSAHVPDVSETDLEREDLEEAANELGLEVSDDLDDQELLERIGLALGELEEEDVDGSTDDPDERPDRPEDAADEAEDATEAAGEEAAETAETADETREQADDASDEAGGTADETGDQANDAADTADGTGDRAGEAPDEAADTRDEAGDRAGEAADEARDRAPVREPGEYRFEDDPREGVEPVLDLEFGPLALDVLGVEIHLRRVHAVLTANPGSRRNVIGKVLAQLSRLAHTGGSGDSGEDDERGTRDDDSGDSGGLLSKVTAPARSIASRVKRTVTPGD